MKDTVESTTLKSNTESVRQITPAKRDAVAPLCQEFLHTYAHTPTGQQQLRLYARGRDVARTNFALITAAAARGDDVTDRVLLQLIPYVDSAANRQRNAWTYVAPAITGDMRKWYERKGWTRPTEWPRVAQAILNFVQRAVQKPEQLKVACAEFGRLSYTKGFQTGTLTPILNALHPDEFMLITNKSRRVLNYLTEANFTQAITDYPAANAAMMQLLQAMTDLLRADAPPSMPIADRFDLFCHWLVTIKKYAFRDMQAWKIAPGEETAQWEEWREGGFVAIGGDEIGDLTDMRRAEFVALRDQIAAEQPAWSKRALEQAWRFAHQIKEGDRVVVVRKDEETPVTQADAANHEVLGMGVVAGAYYFVPGLHQGHCLPVEWDDIQRRRVNLGRDRKTVLRLSQPQFDAIAQAEPIAQYEEPKKSRKPKRMRESSPAYQTAGASDTPDGLPPLPQAVADAGIDKAAPVLINPPYPLTEVAEQTAQEETLLQRWVNAIRRKGQAIIYGPPGTGKTFLADHLARHLIGGSDGFTDLVQFHPSYAYEDFVQGIRPKTNYGQLSYAIVPGRFLEFCQQAAQRIGPCVLIIDEINRANLVRVFGELMVLLEYRDRQIALAGGGPPFAIPSNVYLIGTMNTTDRSIALVDHALRRRFAFLPLYPNYRALRTFHEREQTGFPVEQLVEILQRVNTQIDDKDYAVGIAFFMRKSLGREIEDIWRMEIEPYLEEYFFDNLERVEEFRWAQIASELVD